MTSFSVVSGLTRFGTALWFAWLVLGCSHRADDCNNTLTCVRSAIGGTDAGSFGGSHATGGVGSGGFGTGGITSACSPACSGSKPVCNETAKICVECTIDAQCSGEKGKCKTADTSDAGTGLNICVECTNDSHCSGNTPLCDSTKNLCVRCTSNTDCTDLTASLCSAGTCGPCSADTDCSHIAGKNACKMTASDDAGTAGGTCVPCTVSNETACNGNSCDPATNVCTSTPIGSVGKCQKCKADSECIGNLPVDGGTVTARCVPMTFNGAAHNAYCLLPFAAFSATGCKQPYVLMPDAIASVSGVATETYCGISQSTTTCEAALDLIGNVACTADADCGKGGGLCKTVGGTPNRCTIPCDLGSQCPSSLACTTDVPYCH